MNALDKRRRIMALDSTLRRVWGYNPRDSIARWEHVRRQEGYEHGNGMAIQALRVEIQELAGMVSRIYAVLEIDSRIDAAMSRIATRIAEISNAEVQREERRIAEMRAKRAVRKARKGVL